MHAIMNFSVLCAARFSTKLKDSDSKWQLLVPAMTLTTVVAVTATLMSIVMIGRSNRSIVFIQQSKNKSIVMNM